MICKQQDNILCKWVGGGFVLVKLLDANGKGATVTEAGENEDTDENETEGTGQSENLPQMTIGVIIVADEECGTVTKESIDARRNDDSYRVVLVLLKGS
jgi:hypothetical protein